MDIKLNSWLFSYEFAWLNDSEDPLPKLLVFRNSISLSVTGQEKFNFGSITVSKQIVFGTHAEGRKPDEYGGIFIGSALKPSYLTYLEIETQKCLAIIASIAAVLRTLLTSNMPNSSYPCVGKSCRTKSERGRI